MIQNKPTRIRQLSILNNRCIRRAETETEALAADLAFRRRIRKTLRIGEPIGDSERVQLQLELPPKKDT